MKHKLVLIVLALALSSILSANAQSPNCYMNVSTQNAKCLSGSIVSDKWVKGCREITCSYSASSNKFKMCDKPSLNPYYFEIYRTLINGTRIGFCLNSTCMTNYDFARSQYYTNCSSTNNSALVNSGHVEILAQFSAEHNQVFRCNTTGFTPTQFKWFINGLLVFEKNITIYNGFTYDASHPTFANYFHTFPENGIYSIKCVADNGTNSIQATRQIKIDTRATKQEIKGNIVTPRLNVTYLGNYKIRIECSVFGANQPTSWLGFWKGTYPDDVIDIRLDSDLGEKRIQEAIVPTFGTYNFNCRVGTADDSAWTNYHNYGLNKPFSCFGGPRSGEPECNTGTDTLSIDIPEENIPSHISVKRTGNNIYEAVCNIPTFSNAPIGWMLPPNDYVDSYSGIEGMPKNFSTNASSGRIGCSFENGYTYSAGRSSVWFEKNVNFSQLDNNSQNNSTPKNTTACYSRINNLPATCTATITADQSLYGGACRKLICSQSNGNIQVLACDK